MLHASSVLVKDKAVMFVGKTGRGKTTVTRKLGGLILADDRSMVRLIKGRWWAWSSPFYEQNPFPKKTRRFPLGGIFLLQKRKLTELRINQISSQEAVFRLVPQVVIQDETPAEVKSSQLKLVLGTLELLARKVSVYTFAYPLGIDRRRLRRELYGHCS